MSYETTETDGTPEAYGRRSGAQDTHGRRVRWNKVPEVTAYFWIIKVLCTTVGETAADLLNEKLGLGLTGVSLLMSGLLAVVLVVQFRTRSYRAGVYWLAVAGFRGGGGGGSGQRCGPQGGAGGGRAARVGGGR
ncbi:hypothetical protein ACFWJM_31960, partial [Streptomyces sp. NPDC127077]